jgi:hypothetical protein
MSRPKIEFFTEQEELLDFPPVPASKKLPDWFRKMEPAIDLPPGRSQFPFGLSKALRLSNVNATVRRCPGVISYLSEGYLVPLWTDFLVQVRGDVIYCNGSNDLAQVSTHSKKHQYSEMPLPDNFLPDAVKFINPWKVRTAPGWSILLTAPFYHFEDRFMVVPGVVDSDVYHHIHVNALFPRVDADHKLPMGMPFVHVMPFERKRMDLEVRAMTDKDRKRMKRLDFKGKRFFGKNASIRAGMEED